MKILVLSYEYPPVGSGGGIICKNLSETMASQGHQVTVITASLPGTVSMELHNSENLNLVRLPSRRRHLHESNPLEMLSWISSTKKYFRQHVDTIDFDLCMAHFVLPGGEVARWLKKKYALQYIVVSHGHEIPWVHARKMLLLHAASYCWLKQICRLSSATFVQTRMMKENIDRFVGKKHSQKNHIVPNGISAEHFIHDYTKRPKKLRILFVGRMVLQKDPMTFLKAIRSLKGSPIDFEARFIGDGKLRPRLERFVLRNNLGTKVHFLGRLSAEKMVQEYQSAHIMVAPSLNEGMSVAALEALSCGVYLIASPASGYSEMITEGVNGKIVNYGDVDGIVEEIRLFYNKGKMDDVLADAFLHSFRSKNSWRNIAQLYLDHFSRLLRK